MHYVNPPSKPLENVFHHTFYSKRYEHELGYCIYLPDGYETGTQRYPVFFHLHGWTGNESSEVETLYPVCRGRQAITVFPNQSPVIEDRENLPVEEMLIQELLPLIDSLYRTQASCEGRGLSGFSMGGGMAMYCAVQYPQLFSSVTAYAGTYHHYFYYPDFRTVGAPPEKAAEFYQDLLTAKTDSARSLLPLIERHAGALRSGTQLSLHIGNKDVLYCDNEILRLHLEKLKIPHEYRVYEGAEHSLPDIL